MKEKVMCIVHAGRNICLPLEEAQIAEAELDHDAETMTVDAGEMVPLMAFITGLCEFMAEQEEMSFDAIMERLRGQFADEDSGDETDE